MSTLSPVSIDALIERLNAACPPKPGSVFQDAAHLPEMVVIPAGSFVMGSPEDEPGRDRNEGPQHRVHVGRFAIGKYPVTQRQWHAVMGDNPSYFSTDNIEANADRPVERMSWRRASVYAYRVAELTGHPYRLPSEAEWEYACRAGTTTAYPWGNTISSTDASFNCPDEAIGTSSVYGGRPNAFGLYDMIGNVWEIVADDDHDDYTGAPTDGSVWKVSPARGVGDEVVKRGGSWDLPAEYLRCATRSWADPDNRDELTGFRLAMSLPPDDGNYVEQVVQGEVDLNGERLTLVYGEMNSDSWGGGLPVVRFGKIRQGVLTCQFLIPADTPNLEVLLAGAERSIEQVLVRPNCLPPWEYAKYRCGGFSNVYGEWHWSYTPDPSEAVCESQLPGMDSTQALSLNSVNSADSPPHQEQWEAAEDDAPKRNQLRAEIMAFRTDINRAETMFRESATWWRRKRWMFVLMAVGMLFFGFPGALACLSTIGMMMYIDPMGKASRQTVAAEICLTLSKELAHLLQNEPDNIDYIEGKLAALQSLREQLIRLQQDTPQEAFENVVKRFG